MKYAVIGSRSPSTLSINRVCEYLNKQTDIDTVVTGGAYGMDTVGMKWAASHNVPMTVYRPYGYHNELVCELYDHAPNHIVRTGLGFTDRNTLIIENANIAVVGDYGNGTIDAITKAVNMQKPVLIFGKYIPGRYIKILPESEYIQFFD